MMASSSNNLNPPQRLSEKKKVEQSLAALFKDLDIKPGEVKAPKHKPPGKNGQAKNIDTNMYQVQTSDLFVYRYDVSMTGRAKNGYTCGLTRRDYSSAIIADRHNQCRQAFRLFLKQEKSFFGDDPNTVFYDLQSILFTLKPLNIAPNNPSAEFKIYRDGDTQFPGNLNEITMLIKNVNESAQQIHLDNLSSIINEETLETNRSLLQFIELAINQYPMFNEQKFLTIEGSIYFLDKKSFKLPDFELDRSETKRLAAGVQKSATLIEGFKNENSDPKQRKIGVTLGVKYSPFHAKIPLLEYIKLHNKSTCFYPDFVRGNLNNDNLLNIGEIFQHMRFDVQYPNGPFRQIKFEAFDLTTANTHTIVNLNQTVDTYFVEKYGLPLEFPNAHLVRVKSGKEDNFYPPEVLHISENQIVKTQKLDAVSKKKIPDNCSIRPDRLQEKNKLLAQEIQFYDSPYLMESGIRFSRSPLKTRSRILTSPNIQYANNLLIVPGNEASWQMHRFIRPAICKNYAVYVIKPECEENATMNSIQLDSFINGIIQCARKAGMNLDEPKDSGTYGDNDIEECVKYCSENNIQLCIFITPDHIRSVHQVMKMCEHHYNVVTQEIRMSTAFKINGPRATVTSTNFISKTNMKLGGLNHEINSSNLEVMRELKSTLFISIATNQHGPKSIIDRVASSKNETPGVLSYSANYAHNYNEFLGDFYYTVAYRNEFYLELQQIFNLGVQRFRKNRGYSPKSVVFYYSGCSDVQFEATLKYAVPLIKRGIVEGNNNAPIPLTILAVQENNSVRLFPEKYPESGKDCDYNVKHGTVVDTKIVSPIFNEFYLAAHSPLKGTGRVPRYTIILDENDYSMNLLQGVTHALCYVHQVASTATSLPTPMKVAEDYAKRGRDVLNAEREDKEKEPKLPRNNDGSYDLEQISAMLNYSKTSLWKKRVNA